MTPRVFISYSTKNATEIAFRDALKQALEADPHQYRVLVDSELKHDADDWRQVINTWLGHCDAAILLLSEAALESDYVAYEVDVLTYRWRTERPNFKLFVLYREGLRPEALDRTRLRPARADDIQAILGSVTDEEAIQSTLGMLAAHVTCETLIDKRIRRLAELLSKAETANLNALAAEIQPSLKTELKGWIPSQQLHDKLAAALRGVSITVAAQGIFKIRTPLGGKGPAMRALEYAASGWVDCRTAAELASRANSGSDLAIRTTSPDAVSLYIRSACDTDAADTWPHATVDLRSVTDESSLVATLDAAIAQAVRESPTASHETVLQAIDDYRSYKQPVFVSVVNGEIAAARIDDLRKHYPGVTFLLLYEASSPDEAALAPKSIDVLRPTAPADLERAFLNQYLKERDRFQRRIPS
jgi:TIR domain